MLSWKSLNKKQRQAVCNGCGSKGFLIPVPNFMFKASCDQHDFYYWRGGNEDDRITADKEFFEAMMDDAHNRSVDGLQRNVLKFWAKCYYFSVRFGSYLDKFKKPHKKFWYYGEKRDSEDLICYMDAKNRGFLQ